MTLAELDLITAEDRGLLLHFHARPGSSDPKVITEVVTEHEYRKGFRGTDYVFDVAPGERWLDLGANIGTFSVWAAAKGAEVVAVEPERITHRLLEKNVGLNGLGDRVRTVRAAAVASSALLGLGDGDGTGYLSLGQPGSEWRNTLMKHKSDRAQEVSLIAIERLLAGYGPFDGVKADIEGAELAMFDGNVQWPDKLVFEYHFDIDDWVSNFERRMEGLRGQFDEVRYGKVVGDAEGRYKFFPPSRIVYCWRQP